MFDRYYRSVIEWVYLNIQEVTQETQSFRIDSWNHFIIIVVLYYIKLSILLDKTYKSPTNLQKCWRALLCFPDECDYVAYYACMDPSSVSRRVQLLMYSNSSWQTFWTSKQSLMYIWEKIAFHICKDETTALDISSSNGLLPDGTKPLPESMLTTH